MATTGANATARNARADAIAGVAKFQVGAVTFADRINRAAGRARPLQAKRQIIKRPIACARKLRAIAAAALRHFTSRRRRYVEPDGLARTTEILAQIQHTHAPTPGYQPEPVASQGFRGEGGTGKTGMHS